MYIILHKTYIKIHYYTHEQNEIRISKNN